MKSVENVKAEVEWHCGSDGLDDHMTIVPDFAMAVMFLVVKSVENIKAINRVIQVEDKNFPLG